MKKYMFTGDWILEQMVGIQRYTYQILLELDNYLDTQNFDSCIELIVPSNATWTPSFNNISIKRIGKIKNGIQKHIWQQITFPMYVRKNRGIGVDLTADLPIFGCRVYAIHDCIQEAFPENFSDHKLFLKLTLLKRNLITLKQNCRFVTLTHDSKNELIKYYPRTNGRIKIVSCGWEHMLKTKTDDNIFNKIDLVPNEEYFFSLGSKYKHKNFKWVINVAKNNLKYKFIITGTNIFSNNENELKEILPRNVIFTGYISDEEIKSLMLHSKAVIQPSLYEGFGLPPLEALSLGKKIIISNVSCFPEVYQKSAYYIDPYSEDCNLNLLLSKKVDSAQNVLKRYTWKNSMLDLLDLLKSID